MSSTDCSDSECGEVMQLYQCRNRLAISVSEEKPTESQASSSGAGRAPQRLHLYTEEILKMWNMERIIDKLRTDDQCLTFSGERGLILSTTNCRLHRKLMSLIKSKGAVGAFLCKMKIHVYITINRNENREELRAESAGGKLYRCQYVENGKK
ncbi:unnamed protein product [Diatraea saccharalis]|uniref:Uncharacterized protein n=1 Tax=Diatraea saccharalis TaxID=40085 RepID=A0A9N9WHK6_9NEOP|nr:unnamed protein product [Diatraea saccharalis]